MASTSSAVLDTGEPGSKKRAGKVDTVFNYAPYGVDRVGRTTDASDD